MRRRGLLIALAILTIAGVGSISLPRDAQAQASTSRGPFATKPVLKPDGKKWRIGYYEGGQFPDYEIILKAIVRGMISLGWMEPLEMAKTNNPEPGGFWRYLATNTRSRFIEFVPDAYFASGDFDASKRPATRAAALERLNQRKDIDLMIAMGTWAGQDLGKDHSVPTIVASSSDPIASRIVASADDSGADHLHAKVEPERYQRQLRLFHDILSFKRLGVVYEDSVEGRTFGGIAAVEQVAKERNFQIVPCKAPFNGISRAEAERGVVSCYQQLSDKIDAAYITVHRGVTERSMPDIVAALEKGKVPSFSMLGSAEVRRGVLMSIAQADFSYVGVFHAETIARVFNGAKPRQLSQRWEDPAKIAINIKTARAIGFNPPVDLMLAADEIYETVETPTR